GVNQQYYEGSCLKICNAFVSADNKIRKGDNAACRAFELAQVEQGTSATTRNDHCFNAGPFGGDQCSEPETRPDCQTFCGLTTLICPAAASGYANLSACVTACQAKFASNNKGE